MDSTTSFHQPGRAEHNHDALLPTHELREAYLGLVAAQNRLFDLVLADADAGYPASTPPAMEPFFDEYRHLAHPWLDDAGADLLGSPQHRRVLRGVGTLFYLDGQTPGETLWFPGNIGCSKETLCAAGDVNAARCMFKDEVVAYRKLVGERMSQHELEQSMDADGVFRRSEGTARGLSNLGISRICLKQAYRLIPIVEGAHLNRVQYYQCATRSMVRTTIQAQLERLEGYHEANELPASIDMARKRLNELKAQDAKQPLAYVRVSYTSIRGNLRFSDKRNESGKQVSGHLPAFYLAKPGDDPIECDWSRLSQANSRALSTRTDTLWHAEPDPELIMLRLHTLISLKRRARKVKPSPRAKRRA